MGLKLGWWPERTDSQRPQEIAEQRRGSPRRGAGAEAFCSRPHKETPMLRRIVAAFVVLFIAVGVLVATEVKGKISKIEDKKGTVLTVKVDDKDQKFRVNKDTKITGSDGKEIDVKDAGTKLKEGDEVTIKYEEKEVNGKNRKVVSEITVKKP
jgi:hypothetical protein